MTAKSSPQRAFPHTFLLGFVAIVVFYLATHLWRLQSFPVFADESIYIRWAQLILDDWKQYLFFALNDGKTPLFVWMLAAAQSWSADQLVAGRLVSVLGGLAQMAAIFLILREFGAKKATQLLGMILVGVLPFWFTYHRLAVMDGWLTVWLSLTFWASLKATRASAKQRLMWLVSAGVFYGLALWTKLPALFYLPVFAVVPFFSETKVKGISQLRKMWWPQVLAGIIGLGIFVLLRLTPGFGQLFARGQDFSYSIPELLSGQWVQIIPNLMRDLGYFTSYLTWPVMVLIFAGLFSVKERRKVALLLLCSLIFISPFVVIGKVVYPRYLLPAVLFLTVAAVLSLESLCVRCMTAVRKGQLAWAGVALLVALLAGQVFTQSSLFMANFIFSPDTIPFVQIDRTQYLEEWSSGHGISETVALIRQLTKDHKVAVATEGRFGTLPDGLLLYFHGQNVDNLYIEGTGQYPVKTIPDFFIDRAKNFDQSILVVNSHRMELKLPADKLIAQFCRPSHAPCLQVWDVTALVKPAPSTHTP